MYKTLIDYPFEITLLDSVNPAIWSDKQVKKSIIGFILKGFDLKYIDELNAIYVFHKLKQLNCPWPELDVIEPHVDKIINNSSTTILYSYIVHNIKTPWPFFEHKLLTDPEHAYLYSRWFLKKPWPKAEPIIMTEPGPAYNYAAEVLKRPWPEAEPRIIKDPYAAFEYAYTVLKQPWPEAEPIIMTQPITACHYAMYVLKQPWPEAEPIIMNSIWKDSYTKFSKNFKKKKKTVKESESKFNKQSLIDYPFRILKIDSVDPAFFSDSAVKKAVIKYILNNIQNTDDEYVQLQAVQLYDKLKKLNCTWPELVILEKNIGNFINAIDPHEILIYILYTFKNPWPLVEPYLMKTAKTAVRYAHEVIFKRWPEAEPTIMKNPIWAYIYARDVLKGPWPEAEPYIMSEPTSATKYKEMLNSLKLNESAEQMTQEMQIERVKQDPQWIAHIENPSEPVQLAAIQAGALKPQLQTPIIGYISKPTAKAQLLSIENGPSSFRLINNIAPEVWQSNKAKKSIIKLLTTLISSALVYSDDGTLDLKGNRGANRIVANVIVELFSKLRRQKCPWPELDVIEKHMNDRKIQLFEAVKPKDREQQQIARVTKNPSEIKLIRNPSEAVQLAAVTRNGDTLQYIDEPTDAVKLAAVKQYGHAIYDIENPSEELQLAAVQQTPNAISSIANPAWHNTQIKKIIIKTILDDLSNKRVVFAIILLNNLKRKSRPCPWPELTVIEQHLKEQGYLGGVG